MQSSTIKTTYTPIVLATSIAGGSGGASIKMDGPTVPYTIADVFLSSPRLAITYHVAGVSYDIFTPLGAIVGGAAGIVGGSSSSSTTRAVANGSLVGGALGMTLGLAALYSKAQQGDSLQPLPWNDDGIQTRVNGISQNYKIRTLDLSVWTGLAVAAALYATAKAPAVAKLGLLQTLSLGSTVGSFTGMAFIAYSENQMQKALNNDDND